MKCQIAIIEQYLYQLFLKKLWNSYIFLTTNKFDDFMKKKNKNRNKIWRDNIFGEKQYIIMKDKTKEGQKSYFKNTKRKNQNRKFQGRMVPWTQRFLGSDSRVGMYKPNQILGSDIRFG